jgi:hypothetical protein
VSKHADGSVYCDFINCHLIIAPADRSQISFLKADYHGPCFLAEHRKKKEAAQIPRPAFVTAFLLAFLTIIAFTTRGDEPGDVRGCYVTYNAMTGGFLYEPFLKVRDKAALSENGEPEIWGFRPWNLELPDRDGKTQAVNIAASRFIPADKKLHTVEAGRLTRKLRCPEGFW